jgi:hypothetical protein
MYLRRKRIVSILRDLFPMILIVTGALLSSIDQRINERYFALSSLLTVYTQLQILLRSCTCNDRDTGRFRRAIISVSRVAVEQEKRNANLVTTNNK